MQIGIIGAGSVGGTLGRRWVAAGHRVQFGVRNPRASKLEALVADGAGKASLGTVADAAAFGEVVVLAVPWEAAALTLREAGDLTNKVLLDCTNPFKPDVSGLEVGHDTSGAEQVAAWAPRAHVVKIFNTTGHENMADPSYDGEATTMFYCGDHAPAKEAAARLAADLGFEPIDAGALTQARLLEPLALLWIQLAVIQKHGREIAFRLVRRGEPPPASR